MRLKTRKNLARNLVIVQISIYVFIIVHAVLWHVFGIHILTKLCPFAFAKHVGNFEFNWAVLFWIFILSSTLFLGRAFCAWGCMFGAYQDFVSRAFIKLKVKHFPHKYGKWILRGFLVIMIAGTLLTGGGGEGWPVYFWFISLSILAGLIIWRLVEKKPAGLKIENIPKYIWISQYLGGIIFWWISLNAFDKGLTFAFNRFGILDNEPWASLIPFAIMVAFLIGTIERRIFCKYICPIGLMLRFTSAIPFPKKFKVRATEQKCTKCGRCDKECLMGINPMEEINSYGVVKNPNCINCLVCVSKCPKNAIDFKTK